MNELPNEVLHSILHNLIINTAPALPYDLFEIDINHALRLNKHLRAIGRRIITHDLSWIRLQVTGPLVSRQTFQPSLVPLQDQLPCHLAQQVRPILTLGFTTDSIHLRPHPRCEAVVLYDQAHFVDLLGRIMPRNWDVEVDLHVGGRKHKHDQTELLRTIQCLLRGISSFTVRDESSITVSSHFGPTLTNELQDATTIIPFLRDLIRGVGLAIPGGDIGGMLTVLSRGADRSRWLRTHTPVLWTRRFR